MSVMEAVAEWLYGFEGIEDAQRITPDMLDEGDMSLAALPEDRTETYLDGRRDVTKYVAFRLRQSANTHGERLETQAFLDALENWVWAQNVGRHLPELPQGLDAQSLTVSQSPYLLETDGGAAVYQIGLELNYIDHHRA